MSECGLPEKTQATSLRLPAKGTTGNENTNSITVNLPAPGHLCNQTMVEKSQNQILVSPQPLKIFVDNSTDWPPVIATFLVGIGSVMTTLLVGWLSAMNQRTQIRSNIATFRHKWLEELREATAEFVALMARMHNESKADPKFWELPESNELYSQAIRQHAKISLMLDAKKDYSKKLDDLMTKATEAIKSGHADKATEIVNSLIEEAREVLESAWTDIKRDLQSQKWWGGKL